MTRTTVSWGTSAGFGPTRWKCKEALDFVRLPRFELTHWESRVLQGYGDQPGTDGALPEVPLPDEAARLAESQPVGGQSIWIERFRASLPKRMLICGSGHVRLGWVQLRDWLRGRGLFPCSLCRIVRRRARQLFPRGLRLPTGFQRRNVRCGAVPVRVLAARHLRGWGLHV